MLFRQDHRINIAYPGDFATVGQPLTIRWSARGFNAPVDGSYAVFVDRDPMPPGETVASFDRDSRHRNIYVLKSPRLTIAHLDPNAGGSDAERNHHDITVVLLDSAGRRVGESAGFVQFTVRT